VSHGKGPNRPVSASRTELPAVHFWHLRELAATFYKSNKPAYTKLLNVEIGLLCTYRQFEKKQQANRATLLF
jgi:hypothetical protein